MKLRHYHPLTRLLNDLDFDKSMTNLLDQLNDASSVETSDWVPAIDIQEEDNQFLITADIPGVKPENINIHMDNNVLTIRGERESEQKEKHEGFVRVERAKGSFYRRFSLPETVDADNIKAKSDHGVLRLTIPKKSEKVSRKIEVQS